MVLSPISSRRSWLSFCSAFLACQWCGCEPNGASRDAETDEDIVTTAPSSLPSVNCREVILLADLVLERIYAQVLPVRLPNWIAFHALLMYGDTAYDTFLHGKADGNLRRVFEVILNSNTRSLGPYVMRGTLPYPRHSGPYFSQEHHPGQFLNYFSMSGGSLDAKVGIDGSMFTVRDILRRTLLEARPTGELAYLVLVFSHFLDPGSEWENKYGERVSLAQLLKVLLETPEQTCLGTHRLAALARTYSRPALRENDAKMERLWPALERQVNSALVSLKKSQQSNGNFSVPGVTAGSKSAVYQDIFFGGHSLEWITLLGSEHAHDEWVVAAAKAVIGGIFQTYLSTYRNLDAIGDRASHFNFDALTHAVSAVCRWRELVR